MKKIIKIIVPLVLIFVCVTGAFAQGTLSEEILNQAKREAGLFLELKSALGLDWLDEYNAYLENPTSNPEPSWDLSVADLVNGGYLSDSFPSDFTITKAGQEVKISKIITSQAMKDVLPIYLPSVTIAGDVVSLIVQRPEQWVAWQAGLLGKVSRDGSDNPDILPNAVLDFGKGSEIRFINDDGKLTGIENLIYRDDELDDRFVNTSGDDEMSGTLTAGGFKVGNYIVWHEGNDGHREDGSGLDADLLDGEHGSYYLDAKNLTGIVLPKNLDNPGVKYNIDISGKADRAGDSDTLGGEKKEHFATAAHGHSEYLNKTKTEGDTMAGILTAPGFQLNDANTKLAEGAGNSVRVQTNYGYVDIGPTNSGWAHFNTDRASFYFNKPVHATDKLQIYDTNTYLTGTEGKIAGNKILTTGDYGHRSDGSGINADMVDGKHASSFVELDRFGATSTGGTLDWNHVSNTRPGTGYTLLMGNAPNGPGPAVYFHAFNLEYASKGGTGNVTQFAIPYGNSSAINAGIYYRGRYNGTWTAWKKLGGNAIVEQKLSDRGYVQFSNGFIINWGTVGGGGAYAYFAKPFPRRCFIVVTGQFSRSNIWWDPGHATAAVNVKNSYFRNTGPDSAAYVAFGY